MNVEKETKSVTVGRFFHTQIKEESKKGKVAIRFIHIYSERNKMTSVSTQLFFFQNEKQFQHRVFICI